MTKKKDKQEDLESKEEESKEEDLKTEDNKGSKAEPEQETEEEKTPKKTRGNKEYVDKNYSDMKEKVQDAIKDIVKEEVIAIPIKDMIAEALKPLVEDMKTVTEIAKNHDAKKSEDLLEVLQKEPYEYSKDFVEGKTLIELESIKDTFEASKAFKDFITTQEEANKPNTEIFGASKFEDFVDYGPWAHLYGGKK